jgi:hypothetical protein
MKKQEATHPQVIEYCELRGIDHTNNKSYTCAKNDLEMFLNMEQHKNKTVEEIVDAEFA